METYGIYVASVLTFVAQLRRPPPDIHSLEAVAIRRIAPGPGNWCSLEDMTHGTLLGLHNAVRPLEATCEAAMLRTFHWEAHAQGGIPWKKLRGQLQTALRQSDTVVLRATWEEWLASHTPTVMLALRDKWTKSGVNIQSLRHNIVGDQCGPLDQRHQLRLRRRTHGWFVRKFWIMSLSMCRHGSGTNSQGGDSRAFLVNMLLVRLSSSDS
jgi:hypothetical protein